MAKPPPASEAPTMIIPSGTEIQVDVHGQLSVRTPGNLVIQNSGNYGTLESVAGSIRIEPSAQVEAVKVLCADACYIQGSLTAWKVAAKSIQLEKAARANIVLQETEHLVVGRDARLVGNFNSEKELFLLFSRFAQQFRSLPFFFDRRDGAALPGAGEKLLDEGAADLAVSVAASGPGRELPEPLFFALILMEREVVQPAYGPTSERVMKEVIKLLHERDLDALKLTYRTLFSRVTDPGQDVRRAYDLVHGFFESGAIPSPEAAQGVEEETGS